MSELLRLENIHKTYPMGAEDIHVLRGINLTIEEGEFVAIMGASGSGKSTLLHIAGALDTPDSGSVISRGKTVSTLGRHARHHLRNHEFGFVFQFYHLLPELTVVDNVLLPAMIDAPFYLAFIHARPRKDQALELLNAFGLSHRLKHRPAELSGGERQRVAIARALINNPALLLADEPTGNLDAATGRAILDVLVNLHKTRGQTILMVTHDPNVAALADRTVRLAEGRIKGQ